MEWGQFEKIRELGRGATARVWLAKDRAGAEICLKVFHPGLGHTGEERVRREAEVTSRLRHPNLAGVRGWVSGAESPVLALDYYDGGNLEAFQPSLPYVLPELSVAVVVEILGALEYAHGEGVTHRDLKPANVLLTAGGRVAVGDFGLAHVAGSELTASVGLLGSVDFMAPEQVAGEPARPPCDLFATSAILYFLVTGTRPFTRPTPAATMAAIRNESPEPPQRRNPKVSAALARLILKGLSKEPASRFSDAKAFREALQSYLTSLGLGSLTLATWMPDRSGVVYGSLEHAAEKLVAQAERELAAGEWGAFLESLAHLALKAPSSPALDRLTAAYLSARRRRRRLAFWWPLGAASAAGVAWWLWPAKPSLVAPVPVKVVAATTASPAPPVKPKPVVRRGVVHFKVGDGVRVFWDGKRMNPKHPFEAPVGKHWVLLEREGFDPIRAEVHVKADQPTDIKVD